MFMSPSISGFRLPNQSCISWQAHWIRIGSTSRGHSTHCHDKVCSVARDFFYHKNLSAEGSGQKDISSEKMLGVLDSYPQAQRDVLLQGIQDVDLSYVNTIFKKSMSTITEGTGEMAPARDVAAITETKESRKAWSKTGMKLIAEGKVAILLLAGGQGTRLGSKEPKGCFDVGLPSKKSLFQLHAERILKLQQLATEETIGEGAKVTCPLRWYIMTSPFTDASTRKHFQAHSFFGLLESQIFFFQQGFLPCLTLDGSIIVESDSKIAKSPDGNGGVYMALDKSGCIADMHKHGVECIDCFCVDNLLAKIGDPSFIGYSWELGAECGARVVQKSSAAEKVGVFAIRDGKLQVVEYSEMSESDASAKDDKGSILYPWGNICMHYFTVAFLERAKQWLAETGKYHVAHKKIPSVNGPVEGVKLELFIFDTFPLAKKVSLYEVAREEQFAPVKNATGDDSPQSARCLLLALHKRWIEEAGGKVEGQGQNVGEIPYNISYGGEGLSQYCQEAVIKTGNLRVLDRDFFKSLKG